MTLNEMIEALLAIFPNFTLGEDNSGQLLVYTDVMLTEEDTVVPFKDWQDA